MSIVTANILRPFPGKRAVAEERLKKMASVFERLGTTAKTTNFVAGEYTDCIGLMRSYPDLKTATATQVKLANDAEAQEIRNLRETDPAGEMVVNRMVGRSIFGEAKWASNPVSMLRRYSISRSDVAKALSILEGVKEIMDKDEVNVRAILPVLSDDMSRLSVNYQYKSLEHLGESLDRSASSAEMQGLIEKANEFSTLEAASVMVSF
jgi:hypothetical protein|tara:strand:- start:43 stop:666 length:624 start_codon:yes stop_codon:yes gene_type:complete